MDASEAERGAHPPAMDFAVAHIEGYLASDTAMRPANMTQGSKTDFMGSRAATIRAGRAGTCLRSCGNQVGVKVVRRLEPVLRRLTGAAGSQRTNGSS